MSGHFSEMHEAAPKGVWGELAPPTVLYGHLSCLRYAHEHGAPWDEKIFLWATSPAKPFLDCRRYAFLCGAPWPDAPAELVAWRDRVRGTACTILRTVRNNRAHHAATVIQRAWLERHYAAGGRGEALAMARFSQGLRPLTSWE